MPGFDGTGPLSQGPMAGGGRGYCAFVLPKPGTQQVPYGYAGLQGTPVQFATSVVSRIYPRPRGRWWQGGRRWGRPLWGHRRGGSRTAARRQNKESDF